APRGAVTAAPCPARGTVANTDLVFGGPGSAVQRDERCTASGTRELGNPCIHLRSPCAQPGGHSLWRERKSCTSALNASGFSRKQQWPVAGKILCSACLISAAVRVPPGSALSCSPFTI